MQILEDEHERALLGDCLEEAAPGGKGLVSSIRPGLDTCFESDEGAEVIFEPRAIGGIRDERRDALAKLGRGLLCRVGLEDSRLRLHHLAERPQAHPFPIGQ